MEKKIKLSPYSNILPHTLSVGQAFSTYETTEQGLSSEEAQKRLSKYGANQLPKAKKKSKWVMFLKQFTDLMIIILFIASLVSATVAIIQQDYTDLIDVGIILFIVIMNAVIGFIQEDKTENSLEKLKKVSEPYTKVIRDGVVTKILTTEVVVGDVLILEAGDIACADVLLIESASLKCDESSLTGESHEVLKEVGATLSPEVPIGDRVNIVHSNSVIAYGRGRGIVVNTGIYTEIGKIAKLLNEPENEKTSLQQKLAWLGKFITIGVLLIAVIIFTVTISVDPAHNFIRPLMIAIAIAVAAIPESLPAVITIIMAMGVSRMSKKNAIIRKLHAVETLGSCQIICSDKTGTLTQNKMQVEGVWIDNQLLKSNQLMQIKDNLHFTNCLQLCNDSLLKKDGIVGDPTEVALIDFTSKMGYNKHEIEKKYIRIAELPFDSNRKMMTTFNKVGEEIIAYNKGAPDVLLTRCTRILIDGKVVKLTAEIQSEIEKRINAMASKGWRMLAISYKPHKKSSYNLDDENDLIFVGLVGMGDPPRETTAEAVRVCKSAGMMPIMITGDHAVTAKQIAKEIGIWGKDSKLLTGKELDKLTDAQYKKIIHEVTVYARVSPENKVRIVEMWKQLGKVVAMTGDGVNDAPSIKRADIGIGMGISGTEVTKNVADMILTDDNFATIIVAVKEGRKIYQNIQKVIQFLFGTNFVEVASLFIITLMYPHLIFLLPLQILFINLISDSLPAIALSVEKPEHDIMVKPPRDKKQNIFAGGMWQSMLVQIIVQTALVVGTFAVVLQQTADNTLATTMAFIVLSISQLFHIFNVRSSHSLFRVNPFTNWIMWLSVFVGFALNIIVVTVPALATVFGFEPLSFVQWAICIGLSVLILPSMEVYKAIVFAIRKHKDRKRA